MVKKEGGEGRFMRVIYGTGILFRSLMGILLFLIVFFIFIAMIIPTEDLTGGNVAIIPISGPITFDGEGRVWEDGGVPASEIVEWIKEADEDSRTKAIILKINSPGGSPVATDEIARAVKEAEKPVVSVIGEAGASGAFWIATAADYVFANRMSMTGSIGVRGSRLEFAGLLADYNITYRRLVAGKYKDAGTPWREMTPEEQELFQQKLNKIHAEFVEEVAANRNIPIEKVRDVAHGFVLLGEEAYELGFVDELGNKDDAIAYIENMLNITADTYKFKQSKSFFEELIGVSSYNIGRGLGSVLLSRANTETVKITT